MTHTTRWTIMDWWSTAILLQLSPTWLLGVLIAKGANSKSNSSKSLVDCLQQFNYFCWLVVKIDDCSFLLCAGGMGDHAFGFPGFPWFTDQICVQCGCQLTKVSVARGECNTHPTQALVSVQQLWLNGWVPFAFWEVWQGCPLYSPYLHIKGQACHGLVIWPSWSVLWMQLQAVT